MLSVIYPTFSVFCVIPPEKPREFLSVLPRVCVALWLGLNMSSVSAEHDGCSLCLPLSPSAGFVEQRLVGSAGGECCCCEASQNGVVLRQCWVKSSFFVDVLKTFKVVRRFLVVVFFFQCVSKFEVKCSLLWCFLHCTLQNHPSITQCGRGCDFPCYVCQTYRKCKMHDILCDFFAFTCHS